MNSTLKEHKDVVLEQTESSSVREAIIPPCPQMTALTGALTVHEG